MRDSPQGPRIVRFAVSGGVVAALYVSVMTVLVLAETPAQVALPIAYALAVALHFTLNRHFVFVSQHGYAHALSAQGRRYLAVAFASYALTAVSLAVLPSALDAPRLLIYYVTAATLSLASFLLLRRWVFVSAAAPASGGGRL
jgi:putative flippase GtrA